MNKFLKSTLLASIITFSSTSLLAQEAHTHGGSTHVHEKISQAKAMVIAKITTEKMAKKGTIDKSWEKIDPSRIEKKMFGNSEEWVVSFKNSQMKEAQQTLYIFLDLFGEVTAANYSGK